jgi:hypothetical protein
MADAEKTTEFAQVETAAPAGVRYVHIEPSIQRRVVRKLDTHLMPLVMALCKWLLLSQNT